MFSTFVGLGRFISCQRPDNNIKANDEKGLNTKRKRKIKWQYGDYR